jgi:hypothetical protein
MKTWTLALEVSAYFFSVAHYPLSRLQSAVCGSIHCLARGPVAGRSHPRQQEEGARR